MEPLGTALGDSFVASLQAREVRLLGPDPANGNSPPNPSDKPTGELEPENRSRNWIEMLSCLPPTKDLETEVADLRGREHRFTQDGMAHSAAKLQYVRERAEQRFSWGRERDAIQATRPEGCWCLGLGGRFPRALLLSATTGEIMTYYEPSCICPEASAMSAAVNAGRQKFARNLLAHRLTRVFGSPDLDGYEEARMDNVRVLPSNAAGWERALAYVDPRQPEICEKWLLLFGDIGVGKTWLAVALMRRRMELGEGALFISLGTFLDDLKSTFGRAADGSNGPTTEDVLRAPREVPLLVLDDLGAEYGTSWAETQILGLVNARRKLPTIVTTNCKMSDLAARAGERIASRVVGACGGLDGGNIVRWDGADQRLGAV